MPEEVKEEETVDVPEASEEVKEEKEEKPRGIIGKMADAIVPDHDEQMAIISTLYGLVFWSGPAEF